ncbi:Glycogen synthase [Tetrabaena socialis]|uniref:starch synthase n=1 Tax=Tetrabaena socialis TaxID=47790 RepID=A0A2J7ZZZ4_9CHLO|nr:Glycogen synthase [Tetrabaena socialis]|eukprot:PNH05829.1 Glycogen synthase [Tetrabaena socialis]
MYSEPLAHMIYAAADVVVVPSMYEPCGLTQMIALRYGAVPLVHRTGGLADTVSDVDHGGGAAPRNGFVFDGSDKAALFGVLDRALAMYAQQPAHWAALAQDNMRLDVSWGKSAKSYMDVYRSILGNY